MKYERNFPAGGSGMIRFENYQDPAHFSKGCTSFSGLGELILRTIDDSFSREGKLLTFVSFVC